METVRVTNDAGFVQQIQARTHRFNADEPRSNGGTDTAPSPYELWLAALAACTSLTLRMYADRKGWTLGAITVEASLNRDAQGVETVERRIGLSADLSAEQRTRLAEIAEKTPVTRTVKRGTPVLTRFDGLSAP